MDSSPRKQKLHDDSDSSDDFEDDLGDDDHHSPDDLLIDTIDVNIGGGVVDDGVPGSRHDELLQQLQHQEQHAHQQLFLQQQQHQEQEKQLEQPQLKQRQEQLQMQQQQHQQQQQQQQEQERQRQLAQQHHLQQLLHQHQHSQQHQQQHQQLQHQQQHLQKQQLGQQRLLQPNEKVQQHPAKQPPKAARKGKNKSLVNPLLNNPDEITDPERLAWEKKVRDMSKGQSLAFLQGNGFFQGETVGQKAICWQKVYRLSERHPAYPDFTHQCIHPTEAGSDNICGVLFKLPPTHAEGFHFSSTIPMRHLIAAHGVKAPRRQRAIDFVDLASLEKLKPLGSLSGPVHPPPAGLRGDSLAVMRQYNYFEPAIKGMTSPAWIHVLRMTKAHPGFEHGTHQCVHPISADTGDKICGKFLSLKPIRPNTFHYSSTVPIRHLQSVHFTVMPPIISSEAAVAMKRRNRRKRTFELQQQQELHERQDLQQQLHQRLQVQHQHLHPQQQHPQLQQPQFLHAQHHLYHEHQLHLQRQHQQHQIQQGHTHLSLPMHNVHQQFHPLQQFLQQPFQQQHHYQLNQHHAAHQQLQSQQQQPPQQHQHHLQQQHHQQNQLQQGQQQHLQQQEHEQRVKHMEQLLRLQQQQQQLQRQPPQVPLSDQQLQHQQLQLQHLERQQKQQQQPPLQQPQQQQLLPQHELQEQQSLPQQQIELPLQEHDGVVFLSNQQPQRHQQQEQQQQRQEEQQRAEVAADFAPNLSEFDVPDMDHTDHAVHDPDETHFVIATNTDVTALDILADDVLEDELTGPARKKMRTDTVLSLMATDTLGEIPSQVFPAGTTL